MISQLWYLDIQLPCEGSREKRLGVVTETVMVEIKENASFPRTMGRLYESNEEPLFQKL